MKKLNSNRANICPVCESVNIKYSGFEVVEDGLFRPWDCSSCKCKGNERYDIKFVEHYNVCDENYNEIFEREINISSEIYSFVDNWLEDSIWIPGYWEDTSLDNIAGLLQDAIFHFEDDEDYQKLVLSFDLQMVKDTFVQIANDRIERWNKKILEEKLMAENFKIKLANYKNQKSI